MQNVRSSFHLTVSKDGVVSLWDTRDQAIVPGESYVYMELSQKQFAQLIIAQSRATINNQKPEVQL